MADNTSKTPTETLEADAPEADASANDSSSKGTPVRDTPVETADAVGANVQAQAQPGPEAPEENTPAEAAGTVQPLQEDADAPADAKATPAPEATSEAAGHDNDAASDAAADASGNNEAPRAIPAEESSDHVSVQPGSPAHSAPESVADRTPEANTTPRGYTGTENLGRTITLDELNKLQEKGDDGSGTVTDTSLIALIEESMNAAVDEGEIVTGTVAAITEKEVVIDIGFKSDGVVSKSEFLEEPEIGDTVDVYIDRLEDRRGQLTLSKTKAVDLKRWQVIEEAYDTGNILEGEIVKRIKGGMIVNLLGAEAFLPGSQVDVRRVRDFEAYLGKVMEFKVVKVNPQNGNVVISHKALVEKDLQEQRKKILDSLEVGQVLEGQVKNIVNFGVFVDLGGVDGLLHITDLSWGRVGHPSEVVELDQDIKVVVLDYDKERQRISLGYKQLQPHPWDDIGEKFVEGQVVPGRVVSITDYGAFVELEKGIEGLVHISEMSWTEHIKHPTQKVQLGQTVDVKILNVDEEDKKISLGMKQLEPDPWEGLLDRIPVGTVTTGQVRNITTFGAFVELEPGIDGLVHVSDLSWTKRVKHPSEVVKKGQDLDVVVLDIDIVNRRISLGHKQVQTDPWAQFEEVYAEGTDTTGTVTDINDGGVVVELPLEAESFVPASHLARTGRPADAYEIGQELELRVIRMDRQERELICSETAAIDAEAAAEARAEQAERRKKQREQQQSVREFQDRSSGPATLGELSGLAALRDQMQDDEDDYEDDYEEDE